MPDRAAMLAALPPCAASEGEPARRCGTRLATGLLAVLLGACASGPPGDAAVERDGPSAAAPSSAPRVTLDAIPRLEPLIQGGPNRPYEMLGRSYTPETRDVPLREKGVASWYGRKFHGRRTATGERYDMHAMTAAHKTMPLPSYAQVRNPANGREIVVRVNDRGPFVAGRLIDLSYAAAVKLGVAHGVAPVEIERITGAAIRSGTWRRAVPVAPGERAPAELAAATPDEARAAPAPEAAAPAEPTPVAGTAATSPAADHRAAAPAAPAAARGFWVQLGAFRERAGADDFLQRVSAELDWLAPLMAVFSDAPLFRLQAGPYRSRGEAQGAAERVREALQLVPVIVERR